ncbi:MAG: transposase [Rhodobacteraceae bacterium]|nr:MAG: transposase [Paracoccaceae bacterium]
MATYLRPKIPGATVFFTVALADRRQALLTDHIEALRLSVRKTRDERPFRIDAWVVLPDHLHAVWTLPPNDRDFSTRWSVIKARFSRMIPVGYRRASHEARRERGIWQRRFWEHHIRGPDDFAAALRYCHLNPVKHGYVEAPLDWAYSSVHRARRLGQYAA